MNFCQDDDLLFNNANYYILSIFRWVCEDFPELKTALEVNNILTDCDLKSYESLRGLCDRYNRAIDQIHQLVSYIAK